MPNSFRNEWFWNSHIENLFSHCFPQCKIILHFLFILFLKFWVNPKAFTFRPPVRVFSKHIGPNSKWSIRDSESLSSVYLVCMFSKFYLHIVEYTSLSITQALQQLKISNANWKFKISFNLIRSIFLPKTTEKSIFEFDFDSKFLSRFSWYNLTQSLSLKLMKPGGVSIFLSSEKEKNNFFISILKLLSNGQFPFLMEVVFIIFDSPERQCSFVCPPFYSSIKRDWIDQTKLIF